MILFEIFGDENNPIYQELHISNGNRHYDFLRSIVSASTQAHKAFLSQTVLKAINYHAICCLHAYAGEYRPCAVVVGSHSPPDFYRVPTLMDDLVNDVNINWRSVDPVYLATYVLWRVNRIHPFINGNGRTARAACYYVLCLSAGGWLGGEPIIPELLRRERPRYVQALEHAHESAKVGTVDLLPLFNLVTELVNEQLSSVNPDAASTPSTGATPEHSTPLLPPPDTEPR